MLKSLFSVCKVDIPCSCRIRSCYSRTDLEDAYAVLLPDGATDDPERLARHLHANPPPWFNALLRFRDVLVAPFGIKTSRQLEVDAVLAGKDSVSFFLIFSRHQNEIIYGQDDAHLDFRASLLVLPPGSNAPHRRLVAVTVVKCHNGLGKLYLRMISPFHKLVVIGGLRQAARAGWPPI